MFLNSSKGFPPGVTVGYAKSQVKDILKLEFNKSVELQVNICTKEGEIYVCVRFSLLFFLVK